MLHIFRIEDGVLREKEVNATMPTLSEEGSWIDLVDAEDAERNLVQIGRASCRERV